MSGGHGNGGASIRLLGVPEVLVAGVVVPLSPLERALVVRLALTPGRVVATSTLIDALWLDTPPSSARTRVYGLVSSIRRALLARGVVGLVTSQSPGYLLDPTGVDLDVAEVEDALVVARHAAGTGRMAEAAAGLRAVLDRWSDTALSGVDGPFVEPARVELAERRLRAVEEWVRLELEVGHHEEVVAEVTGLVAAHPLRERLREHLMVALVRTGRRVDALESYRCYCQQLAEEYGLEPGHRLRELQQAALTDQPAPVPDRRAGPTGYPPADARVTTEHPGPSDPRGLAGSVERPEPDYVVPAQLPPNAPGFAGRVAELAQLDAVLAKSEDDPTAMFVATVGGMAGVGKTALVLYWAHQVRDRFPDGQLYLNLRGFGPDESTMDPAEAVRTLLDAVGVAPHRIPDGLAARAGLYRSLLASRRMLLVLDNARAEEQIRPLLPGSPGCLVVVTSRSELAGLVTTEGAYPIALDVPSTEDAWALLERRIGAARMAAEPDAVADIIARCSRLPLALAVVAARAMARPAFPLAAVAAQLRETQGLAAWSGADPLVDVRAALYWSYRLLSPEVAGVLRLVGTHPGPDVGVPAVVAAAGTGPDEARAALAVLTGVGLVQESTPGRYGVHDLVRAYATERGLADDPPERRHTVRRRLYDHYGHTADAAAQLLNPLRADPGSSAPVSHAPEALADHDDAQAWFRREHAVLLGLVRAGTATGFARHTWWLASALTTYLDRSGHWEDWVAVQRAAVEAASALGDPRLRAHAHRRLGRAHTRLSHYDEARAHLTRAIDAFVGLGDGLGAAEARLDLGLVLERRDRPAEARAQAELALLEFEAVGDRESVANALNSIGWYHAMAGEHRASLAHCARALALLDADDPGQADGRAHTLDSMGFAHFHLGQFDDAVSCHRRAADLFHDLGDRYYEARVLSHLGDALAARAGVDSTGPHAGGDATGLDATGVDAATTAWRRAWSLLSELRHPDAQPVADRLTAAGVSVVERPGLR